MTEKISEVYFIPLSGATEATRIARLVKKIMHEAKLADFIGKQDKVAVKQHFGEKGNKGYVKPEVSKAVGDLIRNRGGCPFLVETNTLYHGQRSNSYNHLMLAHDHGFTIERTGMPVVIMDGFNGQSQVEVEIPGEHFKSVNVVSDLPFYDGLMVLTHVKGHMASGIGGAIKNLAMGFASRAGKLAQHADFRPNITSEKCVLCGLCEKFCAAGALIVKESGVELDREKCTGCGECYISCRSGAISFDWGAADRTFQEKMAEHALGAVINHPGKVGYINVFNHVTKNCDCLGGENPVIYEDVGILAGTDPVALDQACIDVAREKFGKEIFRELWPALDAEIQIQHGEKVGLGSRKYNLIKIEV